MDSRPKTDVRRPKRPKKPDREASFFTRLVGTSVQLKDLDGDMHSGKLLWFGPYSLILEHNGAEVLYWKHGLKSIRPANGRGDL